MSKRYSIEQVRDLFKEKGCTLLENHYENNKQPLKYICVCGETSVIKLNHLLNGRLCKSCGYKKASKTKTQTYEEVVSLFKEKGFTLLSQSYEGYSQKLEYICKCGRESYTTMNNIHSIRGCKECWYDFLRSDENPNRSLTTEERHLQRKAPEYAEWRTSVFERDSYNCADCGQHGGSLQAHHLDAFHWCEEKRYDVSNGVTLCKTCHSEFHRVYGKVNNNKAQFNEWKRGGAKKIV
jgi:hypothetical protein